MGIKSPGRLIFRLTVLLVLLSLSSFSYAADRVIIGNVSRTVEQLPNYAATDKGFLPKKAFRVMWF